MYRKVLVPLDGSKLAECSLEEVKKLAEVGLVGEIVLLSVVDVSPFALDEGIEHYASVRESCFKKYREYLEGVRSHLAVKGIEVATVVQEGGAAQIIVNYVKTNAVDMIAISTHGYSGIKRLVFGSVALKVLHDSPVPVLVVRAGSSPETP